MSARHLVTGAAGLLGFELTRQLIDAGDEVVAVDIGKKGGLGDLEALARESRQRLRLVNVDLATPANPPGGRYDTIFHLAAIVGVQYVTDHPYETMAVNMRSTLNVLDFAQREGCGAFVFASSSENYAWGVEAGLVPLPTPENVTLGVDDVALPRWSYAASKIAGESAVFGAARLADFAPVIARVHNVYGPRMGPTHVIPELIERCRRRVDPFPVYGPEQTRSFLYVEDAARALRLLPNAAKSVGGGIYNVGSGDEKQIAEIVRIVLETSGHTPRIENRPAPRGSVARRVPDVTKLAQLGFKPTTSLAQGVRACWTAR
jgi:UDP-glucose 4-epimerase/UDP-glucuronate decarboxylase